MDAPAAHLVIDGAVVVGREVHAVRLAREGDAVAALAVAATGHLVDVEGARQAVDDGAADVLDGEVRVQGLADEDRLAACVGDGQFQVQGPADGDRQAHAQVVGPDGAGLGIRGEGQLHPRPAIGQVGGAFHRPRAGAHEAMGRLRRIRMGAEPRQAQGDAAADGFAGLVEVRRAGPQHGGVVAGLPMGHRGAQEVDLGLGQVVANGQTGKAADTGILRDHTGA